MLVVFFICGFIDVTAQATIKRARLTRSSLVHSLVRSRLLSLFIFGVAYLVVTYMVIFMNLSYDQIPEQFRGGRPSGISLLIKEDSIPGARELGVPISINSVVTDRVPLVYEGSDSYVIKLDNGSIVRLNKDTVSGAVTRP